MRNPFLVGKRIYLRRIERDDLSGNYFQWLNDQEVTRWLQRGAYPNSIAEMEAYFQGVINSQSDLVLAIVLNNGDRHIGNIGIHRIHPIFRSAEIGILIGEKDTWGQGYGTEAIGLLVDHAFRRMNLNRLYAGAVDKNTGSISAFEKVGFIREGVSREAYFVEGAYADTVQMGFLYEEWKVRQMTQTGV